VIYRKGKVFPIYAMKVHMGE